MTSLFRRPKLPPAPAPAPAPEITPEDTGDIQEKERKKRRTARGRRSTFATSPRGIQEQAQVLKTKLGGQ